jgi:hypothetical protein
MIQDIIVYTIILGVLLKVFLNIMNFLLPKKGKTGSICKGCASCGGDTYIPIKKQIPINQ